MELTKEKYTALLLRIEHLERAVIDLQTTVLELRTETVYNTPRYDGDYLEFMEYDF